MTPTPTTAELHTLLAGITPGPWESVQNQNGTGRIRQQPTPARCACVANMAVVGSMSNARAIAQTPALLAEVIALRGQVDALKGALQATLNQADALNGTDGEFAAYAKLPDIRTTPAYIAARAALAQGGDK